MDDIIQGNQRDIVTEDAVSRDGAPGVSSSQVLCLLLPNATQKELKGLFDAMVDLPTSLNKSFNK